MNPTSETATRTIATTASSNDQSLVVEKRLHRQGRKRLLRLSPLGWCAYDMTVAALGCAIGYAVSPYIGLMSDTPGTVGFVSCAVSFSLLIGGLAHIVGLHDNRFPQFSINLTIRTASVIGLALSVLTLGWLFITFLHVGRYVLVTMGIMCLVGMVGARLLSWNWSQNFSQSVCFLGGDDFCFRVAQFLDDNPLPVNIRTRLDFEQDKHAADLGEWAIEHNVDEIVYDASSRLTNDDELLKCLAEGIRVSSYSDFVEENFFKVPVESIDAGWLFSAQLDLAHPYYQGMKRLVDVVVSVTGLVLTAPLMLLAILCIKFESRGPALYSQVRVGRFNRAFHIYKLRTMVQDAESGGAQWAATNDSRITRVGKFLRKTRLDEVPQFWNVLKGEMSLVGPRPERPEFVATLSEEIPFYTHRHLVKPGVTGWAQINYPYGASVQDSQNKLTYDLYYIKRASLGLDLQILLRTTGALMSGSR